MRVLNSLRLQWQGIVALALLTFVRADFNLKSKCENARPITVGTVVTTNLQATFYGPIVMAKGHKALRASMNNGWFPGMDLYEGSCDSLTRMVEDAKDESGTVTVEWRPVQNSTYYVAVYTVPNRNRAETLLEYITPPANDRQHHAANLELNGPYLSGSTVNATTGDNCSAKRDVWYSHKFATSDRVKLRIVGTQHCLTVGVVINCGQCSAPLKEITIPPDWSPSGNIPCPDSYVIPLKPQAGDTYEFSVSFGTPGYDTPSPGESNFKIKLFTY